MTVLDARSYFEQCVLVGKSPAHAITISGESFLELVDDLWDGNARVCTNAYPQPPGSNLRRSYLHLYGTYYQVDLKLEEKEGKN